MISLYAVLKQGRFFGVKVASELSPFYSSRLRRKFILDWFRVKASGGFGASQAWGWTILNLDCALGRRNRGRHERRHCSKILGMSHPDRVLTENKPPSVVSTQGTRPRFHRNRSCGQSQKASPAPPEILAPCKATGLRSRTGCAPPPAWCS